MHCSFYGVPNRPALARLPWDLGTKLFELLCLLFAELAAAELVDERSRLILHDLLMMMCL